MALSGSAADRTGGQHTIHERHRYMNAAERLSLSSTEDSFYLSVYNDGPRLPEAELSQI